MKGVYDFCSTFEQQEAKFDSITQQLTEIRSTQPLIQSYEQKLLSINDPNQKSNDVHELLDQRYIHSLIQNIRLMSSLVLQLLDQEQILKQKKLPEYALFCRNNHQHFCGFLSNISNSVSIVRNFKEQNRINKQIIVNNQQELQIMFEKCINQIKDNQKTLNTEAYVLKIDE